MIAKVIKGASFSGVLSYILGKEDGKYKKLHAEGVLMDASPLEIANEFNLQASMRPNVKKPVCHTILSFSAEDAAVLDDSKMTHLAQEYLKKMGYDNTQYLIVRHMDREHPHLHICINRIDNNGKTISDSNEKFRSTKVCKELTQNNMLKWGEGKKSVKRHRLRGSDKIKYEIFDSIKQVLPDCRNWKDFATALSLHGVEMRFKTKGNTNHIEGVLFEKDGISFSGSHIDRSCSYSKLSKALEQNVKKEQDLSIRATEDNESVVGEMGDAIADVGKSLFGTASPAVDVAELLFQRKLRNQANKKFKRRKL